MPSEVDRPFGEPAPYNVFRANLSVHVSAYQFSNPFSISKIKPSGQLNESELFNERKQKTDYGRKREKIYKIV